MKRIKKLLAVMLAAIMVMSMGTSVFAWETSDQASSGSSNGSNSVTITGVASSNHTFTAYQIFSGTLSNSGTDENPVYVLSDISWGDCVNGETLLNYLSGSVNTAYTDSNNEAVTWKSLFENCSDAADVAEVLTNYNKDDDLIKAFAELLATYNSESSSYTYLKAYSVTVSTAETDTTYTYKISSLAAGYYLITDSLTNESNSNTNETVSDYFLQVAGKTSVETKTVVPSLTKEIVDSDVKDATDDASTSVATAGSYTNSEDTVVFDTVTYQLKGTVPDMTDYSTYSFKFTDTLGTGLTLDSDSIKVYVNSVSDSNLLTAITDTQTTGDYTVTIDDSNSNKFTVEVSDLKTVTYGPDSTAVTKNDTIIVVYSAALNSSASVGSATTNNTNSATLTYSNDPNSTSTGTTTTQTTTVYTTSLTVTKTDGETKAWADALSGVKFKLYEKVDSASDATGYMSSSNAYTEGTSGSLSDGQYWVRYIGEITISSSGGSTFSDLNAGTYVLVESETPTGYNTIDPITFTISYSYSDGSFSWAAGTDTSTTTSKLTLNSENGTFSISVENNTGSAIPSTGGIGTTIFYVVGAILVLGAGVVLITRRRMASK